MFPPKILSLANNCRSSDGVESGEISLGEDGGAGVRLVAFGAVNPSTSLCFLREAV